jgi:hypothetical protein
MTYGRKTMKENDLYPKPLPIAATKQYLSRIPSRNPIDKVHKKVNHAKSAVNNYFIGYKGETLYHKGHGGTGWGQYVNGFDKRGYDFKHTGCEMEIYELVDGAWSLLYTIKRGDVELPWKKGELAANIEKVDQKLAKEEADLTKHIRTLAEDAHLNEEDPMDIDDYIAAFDKGYRAGMEHKK